MSGSDIVFSRTPCSPSWTVKIKIIDWTPRLLVPCSRRSLLVAYEGMCWSPAPEPAPHQRPLVPTPHQCPPVPAPRQCPPVLTPRKCSPVPLLVPPSSPSSPLVPSSSPSSPLAPSSSALPERPPRLTSRAHPRVSALPERTLRVSASRAHSESQCFPSAPRVSASRVPPRVRAPRESGLPESQGFPSVPESLLQSPCWFRHALQSTPQVSALHERPRESGLPERTPRVSASRAPPRVSASRVPPRVRASRESGLPECPRKSTPEPLLVPSRSPEHPQESALSQRPRESGLPELCIYTLFNAAQREMECFNQLKINNLTF